MHYLHLQLQELIFFNLALRLLIVVIWCNRDLIDPFFYICICIFRIIHHLRYNTLINVGSLQTFSYEFNIFHKWHQTSCIHFLHDIVYLLSWIQQSNFHNHILSLLLDRYLNAHIVILSCKVHCSSCIQSTFSGKVDNELLQFK